MIKITSTFMVDMKGQEIGADLGEMSWGQL